MTAAAITASLLFSSDKAASKLVGSCSCLELRNSVGLPARARVLPEMGGLCRPPVPEEDSVLRLLRSAAARRPLILLTSPLSIEPWDRIGEWGVETMEPATAPP